MTKDRGEDYGLVRGFLLAHAAPLEVLQALEKLEPPRTEASGPIDLGPQLPLITPLETEALLRPEPQQDTSPPVAVEQHDDAPASPVKKRRNFSPETRAAAAERMRQMHARRRAEKDRVTPGEADPPF